MAAIDHAAKSSGALVKLFRARWCAGSVDAVEVARSHKLAGGAIDIDRVESVWIAERRMLAP